MTALKALTQVASPSRRGAGFGKGSESRPALKMNPQWVTSASSAFTSSTASENQHAGRARAAGGLSATKTLHDKTVGLFVSQVDNTSAGQPLHLRSAFDGGGVVSSGAGFASPRCSSPRCQSPRYLQHTMASALRVKNEAAIHVASIDVANMEPAGGDSNMASKFTMDLSEDQPRRLRRTLSAPRSRAAGCFVDSPAPEHPAATEALEPPLHSAEAVRLLTHATSHDKSLPNARRSQRAAGTFVPGPPMTSVEALAASTAVLTTDAGFASTSITRRARGLASPMALRPGADPNPLSESGLATQQRSIEGAGVASGVSTRDSLLLGRRARGACSPGGVRSGAPYQWD